MMAAPAPYRCPACGKKSPQHRISKWSSVGSTDFPKERPSPGDVIDGHKVVKVIEYEEQSGRRGGYLKFWNGKYRHRYEPFCTMRCGMAFAFSAFFAGFQMKKK